MFCSVLFCAVGRLCLAYNFQPLIRFSSFLFVFISRCWPGPRSVSQCVKGGTTVKGEKESKRSLFFFFKTAPRHHATRRNRPREITTSCWDDREEKRQRQSNWTVLEYNNATTSLIHFWNEPTALSVVWMCSI